MENKGPDDIFAHAQDDLTAHVAHVRRIFFSLDAAHFKSIIATNQKRQ